MKKQATILDIAREVNVSPSTVSRALNGNLRISEDTRRSIERTAKRLGYRRNHLATSLRRGKNNVLGVIVPFTDNSFFSSIIRGIEDAINNEGFNVMICQSHDSHDREVRCIEALMGAGVSAIAMTLSGEVKNYDHILKTASLGMPFILFDRVLEELDVHTVMVDDYRGAFDAVSHLVEMKYKKVALFTGNREINIYRERFRGYKDAIEHYKLVWNDDYILSVSPNVDAGKAAAKQLFQLPDRPDAILSTSDFSALGAMDYLKDRVRIPGDFGIMGFSNEPFTKYVHPSLSTVDQQSQRMGKVIGQSFIGLLGDDEIRKYPLKTLLKPKLIIRNSTKRF